jgi:aspartyl-tRNA(Asn)/glutamyl-tRNA(Gln) amidotransferase subunit A
MSTEPLWSLTAAELAGRYKSREATPEQALQSVIDRIEEVNPRLNAIVTLDVQGAMQAARDADARWVAGGALGLLDGIPFTVKDNLFVGGLRATWGSLLFADHVAHCDDLPVARLRQAGAVIVGKTNTPELAMAAHTNNKIFGETANPWNTDLSPGGSSGGAAAAVASGCAPFAIGTDAGGSIRRPAGHCGVAGLKPGAGRVPRRFGFPPLAQDLQVVGPIARSVADLKAVFAQIAVPAWWETEPRRLRIGAFAAIGDAPIEPAVAASFEAALSGLRALGHQVDLIDPIWDTDEVGSIFDGLVSSGIARVLAGVPAWEVGATESIANQGRRGAQRSAVQYIGDLDRLTAFRWRMQDAIVGFDAIATPSASCLPWPRSQPSPKLIGGRDPGPRGGAIFSTAVNLAGLPAVALPAPIEPHCMPAGFQLIGAMNGEETLLDLAEAYERQCPWPRLAPI